MQHQTVILLLVLVKICHGLPQYQLQRNSSYGHRQDPVTSEIYQYGQRQEYHHTHHHQHNHGQNHCNRSTSHAPSEAVYNTTKNISIWPDTKSVPIERRGFPDPVINDSNTSNILSNHKVARNINDSYPSHNCTFGICDTVKDYPTEKIANIISKSRELRQYFANLIPSIVIDNRFAEDDPMCPTRPYYRFPQSAKNTKDVEMLLVNVDERFKQGVFYETCLNDGAECTHHELFPTDYTTTCIQKYITTRLLAIEKESVEPVFDNFKLPSCCVCTIKTPSKP